VSYILADSTGYLDEFASIGGLSDFIAWAQTMPDPLKQLAQDGYTENIDDLIQVIDESTPPTNVLDQVNTLRDAAGKAKDLVIVSDGLEPDENLEALGGKGSGNFGHAGRKGEIGGSAPGSAEAEAAEIAHQEQLSHAQTDPLAHPDFVIGGASGPAKRYVAAYGERFEAASLPDDIRKGIEKQCYRNTSLMVMENPDLDYAEGWATHPDVVGGQLAFQHAWGVTKDGKVVDPTWQHPEKASYFGIRYDREKYLKYLYKAKLYGVLGSTDENARKAMATGGMGLIKEKK